MFLLYLKIAIAIILISSVVCYYDRSSRHDAIAWRVVIVAGFLWVVVVPVAMIIRSKKPPIEGGGGA
jgi:hypothetical protein